MVLGIYKAYSYIYGGGVETRGEGSGIYKTHITLAVYIQEPAVGFSTSPC